MRLKPKLPVLKCQGLIKPLVLCCYLAVFIVSSVSAAPENETQPNLCDVPALEGMIRNTEVGSIYYKETYEDTKVLGELGISPVPGTLQFAELSSHESFGSDLPEKTKELISRFINTGNPHFVIVYHCPTEQITDVRIYADYWGAFSIPITKHTELPVKALYQVGPKYRKRKISTNVIKTISRDFKNTLSEVFHESQIKERKRASDP